MTTRKLYHEDTALLETTASILDISSAEGGWWVVPDRTVIFPGGGGQPGDLGWIDGVEVRESEAREESVAHRLDTLPPGAVAGATVTLRVDAQRRRESAQQHTGQHIVSAALLEHAGIETVSVHMGEDTMTVESPVPALEIATLRAVQARANAVIRENRAVVTHVVDAKELDRFRLRRPPAPRDRHRVVEIQGYDASACGGVHVGSSGEVGLVVWAGSEKIRGNTRTHWLVGDRAWRDLEEKGELVRWLGRELSAAQGEILDAVRRLRESGAASEHRAAILAARVARLEADRLAAGVGVATAVFEALDREVFRALVQELSRRPDVVALLANREGETAQLAACHGSARVVDLGAALRPHLHLAGAAGGGKGPVWQGVARKPEGLESFFREAAAALGGSA